MSEQNTKQNCTTCPPILIWAFAAIALVNIGILIAIFWKL